ncbi:hypothetical protein ACFE04_013126 [Oxalis oulophora]
MIEEGKMRCPESFPKRLRNRLSNYVSLRTLSGLSWIVDLFEVIICAQSGVEISYLVVDLPHPSNDEYSGLVVNENRSWFSSCHDCCSVFVAGEEKKNCRISWNHREGRSEAAICSGGLNFAVKELKPSVGDTVEFELVFDNANKHSFNIRILEIEIADRVAKLEVGSSSKSKRTA